MKEVVTSGKPLISKNASRNMHYEKETDALVVFVIEELVTLALKRKQQINTNASRNMHHEKKQNIKKMLPTIIRNHKSC